MIDNEFTMTKVASRVDGGIMGDVQESCPQMSHPYYF